MLFLSCLIFLVVLLVLEAFSRACLHAHKMLEGRKMSRGYPGINCTKKEMRQGRTTLLSDGRVNLQFNNIGRNLPAVIGDSLSRAVGCSTVASRFRSVHLNMGVQIGFLSKFSPLKCLISNSSPLFLHSPSQY